MQVAMAFEIHTRVKVIASAADLTRICLIKPSRSTLLKNWQLKLNVVVRKHLCDLLLLFLAPLDGQISGTRMSVTSTSAKGRTSIFYRQQKAPYTS